MSNRMRTTFLSGKSPAFLLAAVAFAAIVAVPQRAQPQTAESHQTTILHAADAAKVMPPAVFFQGQSANVQGRNSVGLHFADGAYTLAALVDTGGYSTSVQQRYQGYLITEVPLQIGSHHLAPGAYGFGFVANNNFLVMDIGGHDLLSATSTTDAALKRPTPLQMIAAEGRDCYRLYGGRNYATLCRASDKTGK